MAIVWIGFNKWREVNKIVLSDIEKMRVDEQIKITKELYDISRECLEKILINPEKNKNILERQKNKAFKYHLNLFHKLIKQAKRDGTTFFFI